MLEPITDTIPPRQVYLDVKELYYKRQEKLVREEDRRELRNISIFGGIVLSSILLQYALVTSSIQETAKLIQGKINKTHYCLDE